MLGKNVVVLDGASSCDEDLSPVLKVLLRVLERRGAQVVTFPLRAMKLAHCIGCFDCWLKTPGTCVEADAGREIARAVIRSDTTVFFTPVTFGGYSPELKRIIDRFIQLISPFFQMEHGEVHHPPRYQHRPRLVMVGVQREPNPHEARIFRTVAGRNAINFHPPSYAADVVLTAEGTEAMAGRFDSLVVRSDGLPFGEAAASLMPPPAAPGAPELTERRALLIVGSPKTKAPITSSVLGNHVLDRLQKHGWETETLALRATLNRAEGELLSSLNRAGLVLLVFPLYADALPYLVTKALDLIARNRRAGQTPRSQRLVAIVNSGFPETHQNALALAICREFAVQCGFSWAGSLALGGGGIVGGEPLAQRNRSGPPVPHIVRALDMTADALAEGLPVPADAVTLIARNPMPVVPLALWRWLYVHLGSRGFVTQAKKNGIRKEDLLAQPYAA